MSKSLCETQQSQSQTSTLTLTISEVAEFVEEQIKFFAQAGQEIPEFIYMSYDVVNALVINNGRFHSPLHNDNVGICLQFHTSHGSLFVKKVKDKENYISVGGVDYLTMLAEQELLCEQ